MNMNSPAFVKMARDKKTARRLKHKERMNKRTARRLDDFRSRLIYWERLDRLTADKKDAKKGTQREAPSKE